MRTSRGGRINRSRPLGFAFDGARYRGFAGDTLASALIANGVATVARSFKYHRPRGVLAWGSAEPNAIVELDAGPGRVTPNLRATEIELYEGLVARSQNAWPSLSFDIGAVAGLFAPLLPSGFYYKTFIGPRGAWERLYEPVIRRAAGMGRAPRAPDPDRYGSEWAHCDVAVVGGGPAGLTAALAAARAGRRVMLIDEGPEFGGSLLGEGRAVIDGLPAAEWPARAVAELESFGARLLLRTQVFGYYSHDFLAAVERFADPPSAWREKLWRVRAKRVVLATGAHERPLVFPGNDRPGVVLADAARAYAQRFGALVGRKILVATAHDAGHRAALELAEAGAEIVAVVDSRAFAAGSWPAATRAAGLKIFDGASVVATRGRLRVSAATIAKLGGGGDETLACDAIAMSGGFTPNVSLFSQSAGKLRFDATSGGFVPDAAAENPVCVGACGGEFDLSRAMVIGANAGDEGAAAPKVEGAEPMHGGALGLVARLPEAALAKAFVDFQNDVTARDILLATREGMRSIEHLKRYTTTGMATDQGRNANLNALAIAAEAQGKRIWDVGLTTFRPPDSPVTFAALAGASRGERLEPVRETPIHPWYVRQGAVFEAAGLWKRASRLPRAGESKAETVAREVISTRSAAGIMDASTLGKIEVVGPDAPAFLDRLYVNSFTKLGIGRCRYGLMLNEMGYVYDDGVVARLADDRFHITTTSGGTAHVWAVMEDYRQTEWTDLRVYTTSITEQWATIAINGPSARKILAPLIEGIDLAPAAFPHMSLRAGRIAGVPLRLARVSFTGELGFEVNVPADYGLGVQAAIWDEARKHGASAYGLDALLVMRAEKGFIVVGQETDGTVTADDLGFGRMVAMNKREFIGKRSLTLPDLRRPGRKQLVGLLAEDAAFVLDEGAQVVSEAAPPLATPAQGHVTSSYMSPTLKRSIAMALIADGRARLGERVHVTTLSGTAPAKIVEPIFYDKEGRRLEG